MGGGRGRQRSSGGRERGADLRYNMEISLEEAFSGKTAQILCSNLDHLRYVLGFRRQARHATENLWHLSGLRPRSRCAGLFLDRTNLPDLSWPRPDHSRSMPQVPWPGPRNGRAFALGQYSGWYRRWHAHPLAGRRRGRHARRTGGRSLYFPVGEAARILSARWSRPLLRRSGSR